MRQRSHSYLIRRGLVDVTIIGVDCAAQAKNTGLARAITDGDKLTLLDTCCASSEASAASTVCDWVRHAKRVLLALDAPLGWPAELGRALARHQAGEALAPPAHKLFRRMTDDLICERLGRRPLDVGADRIARTAHAALWFLKDLRESLGSEIPLVWSPHWRGRFGVIEVYPAATRIALGVPRGRGSLAGLESRLTFHGTASNSEHARDAVVCTVAGLEFLSGRTVVPRRTQMRQARQEGWIWAGRSAAFG
jgi:predicted nuclease with RNAse H fold